MDFKNLLGKLDQLNEAEMTSRKIAGKAYGGAAQHDDEEDDEDGEKKPAAPAVKRGRGRPRKAGGEVDTGAKYSGAQELQKWIVGSVPKDSKSLKKLPKTKHSLKEHLEQVLAEAEQLTIEPAKASTQVIKQGSKVLGQVSNPQLAATIKQAIGKGEMSLAGDELGEADYSAKAARAGKDIGKPGKQFAKIAKSAAERYGSKERGEKVAGAVLAKLRKTNEADMPPNDSLSSPLTLESKKGVAEGSDKLQGTPVVSLKDLGDKDTKKDRYGRTVPKKLKKDDPRVKFHKDEKQGVAEETFESSGLSYRQKMNDRALIAQKEPTKSQPGSEEHKQAADFHEKQIRQWKSALAKHKSKPEPDSDKWISSIQKEIERHTAGAKHHKDSHQSNQVKKGIKEGMDQRLKAAHLEGRLHGLKGHAHCGKNYDDMEEARCYHEGYKEGLDECYGMLPIRGVVVGEEMPASTIPGMASQSMNMPTLEDDMEEGNAFTAALAKTKHGEKFNVGGKTFTDTSDYDAKVDEMMMAFENWDKQLNALLTESEVVEEGMSISVSKGQQGAPDSVSVTASDAEADSLMALVKQMGIFGDEKPSGYGAPEGEMSHSHGDINVVDDHDGMMALMKKLSGQDVNSADYADEEHSHEHEGHDDAEVCEVCGESECRCDDEMVDEIETPDQMEFQVSEDNPPDSGAAEEEEEIQDTAQANKSAAEQDTASELNEGECSECGHDPCECDHEDVSESVLEEWANEAGKKGTDEAFDADIAFMTKVISGGLNKQKSTGQTTVPVIAHQNSRMGVDGMNESNDILADWKKLSGIR